MLFRRLSTQRTIFIVVFVGGLLIATFQVIHVPHFKSEASSSGSSTEKDQAWKLPVDWPKIGSFWEKEDVTPQCPTVHVAQEPAKEKPVQKTITVPVKAEDKPLRMTKLIKTAPGWTIFDNVYAHNGTIYIVSDNPSEWPPIRMMTSTGLPAENTPQNIATREPTDKDMKIISMKEAEELWGDRVWPVNGPTFMVNDPKQFVSHFYHFVAETWMGLWRFYSSLDSNISVYGETTLEPPARVIYTHLNQADWRDYSFFNQYFMHAVFPSISMESQIDWEGRANITTSKQPNNQRVFRFQRVLFQDRSASFRGELCPSRNNRIVSEAWAATRNESSRWWWEPARRAVLRLAGVDQKTMDWTAVWAKEWGGVSNGDEVPTPQQIDVAKTVARRMPIVVTYVVRLGHRRVLIKEDHENLVRELKDLCERKNWELNIVSFETMTNDEQIQLAARTTILLGVHGNGLTHLLWMPLTPATTVIEIFFPTGFAKDYEWTARALGMRHYAIWGNTSFTHPNEPAVATPEGFQGNNIPADGALIAKLIEDRVEGRLP